MPDQIVITDAGKTAISNAIVLGNKVNVTKYEVGDSSGYTPTSTQTSLQGTVVFTDQSSGASSATVSILKIGDETFELNLLLDTQIGDFTVGEYAFKLDNGTFFCIVSLGSTIEKVATSGNTLGNVINLRSNITIANAGDSINVSSSSTIHNSLNEVPTEGDLPLVTDSSSNIYIVRNYNTTGIPSLAYKDTVSSTWRFLSFS